MKKIITEFLLLAVICVSLTSCSAIKGIMQKIPFFEEADIDSLTDKAEKAWEEVGKDALKDAAGNVADTLFGEEKEIVWPENDSMKDIPKVSTGIISKVSEKNSITEIVIDEITISGYQEYISLLNEAFGNEISNGIYRLENRLISAIYDEENSTLVVTVSVIRQNIETSDDEISTENETSE